MGKVAQVGVSQSFGDYYELLLITTYYYGRIFFEKKFFKNLLFVIFCIRGAPEALFVNIRGFL